MGNFLTKSGILAHCSCQWTLSDTCQQPLTQIPSLSPMLPCNLSFGLLPKPSISQILLTSLSTSFAKTQLFSTFFHISQDLKLLLSLLKLQVENYQLLPLHQISPCPCQSTNQCLGLMWRFTRRMSICSHSLVKIGFSCSERTGKASQDPFLTSAPMSLRPFVGVESHCEMITNPPFPPKSKITWFIFTLPSSCASHLLMLLKASPGEDSSCLSSIISWLWRKRDE